VSQLGHINKPSRIQWQCAR